MITSLTRDVLVAMLSRFMGVHGLTCNFRIVEGHEDTFTIGNRRAKPDCTIVFYRLAHFALFALSPRLLTFAKLFIDGHVEVEGDWFEAAKIVNRFSDHGSSVTERLLGFFASTQSVETHYGWSAEAFGWFLDHPYMQYTCGRLQNGDNQVSLEESQLNKLALIARWLEVKTGQRHLDIGCGWGGLIQYLVEQHGTVSHGVTLAPEQASFARAKVPSAEIFVTGFEDHKPSELYDVATVVGMLEHLPVERHAEFFQYLATAVRQNGRVYLQCITRTNRPTGDRTRFLNAHVFTHELNSLESLVELAHKAGFTVAKAEEGHEDYAFTTQEWVKRIRAHEVEIRCLLKDDKVYRILLGYLTMGSLSFADNHSNLHRLLLVKK